LAAGFLLAEGIISGKHHIDSIAHCLDEDGNPAPNVINILPAERNLLEPGRWGRNFIAASSCGLCGKTSISQVKRQVAPLTCDAAVRLDTLYTLPAKLTDAQDLFAQTGGMHAAGLFDLDGRLLLLREDVGRHNAVDKVVGYALLNEMLPLDRAILVVSSRASFEIVQKALLAGVGVVAAISAPSSLAIELAREAGMTLVGFLREERLNVYSGEWRING
jgi:FdhD protein